MPYPYACVRCVAVRVCVVDLPAATRRYRQRSMSGYRYR